MTLLNVLDPNSPSLYVKCPRKCQKPIILTFFLHFPKFTPLPLPNFGINPKFDRIPLYILLKLHYAKFDVSRLFCSKVIEKKL